MVLRDGLIEAVGSGARPPADARVIDVKGLTLTPGIIDGFGGVGLPAPRAAPRRRGRRQPRGRRPARRRRPSCSTACAPPMRSKARDTGVTTALVVPREGVLPGRSVLAQPVRRPPGGDGPAAARGPAPAHGHHPREVPGLADGDGGLRAPGPARCRALSRELGRVREGAARPQAAALRLGAGRVAGRAGGPAGPGRDRHPRERHPPRAGPGRRVQGEGRHRGRHAGAVRRPTSSRPAACRSSSA